jgi:hypothetical protein
MEAESWERGAALITRGSFVLVLCYIAKSVSPEVAVERTDCSMPTFFGAVEN